MQWYMILSIIALGLIASAVLYKTKHKKRFLTLFVIVFIVILSASYWRIHKEKEGLDNMNSTDSSTDTSSTNKYREMRSSGSGPFKYTDYDNYNHFSGTAYPSIFYGPQGGTAKVIERGSDVSILITHLNGSTETYNIASTTGNTSGSEDKPNEFNGPSGNIAKIITDENGQRVIEITGADHSTIKYRQYQPYDNKDSTINQYSGSSSSLNSGSDYQTAFTNLSSMNATNTNAMSTNGMNSYMNSLPKGIRRSEIPAGQEDLYILKSEIVPPVCPKCPDPILKCPDSDTPDTSKCPPCPACARCPEPSFECKKVPNYNAFNSDTMPVPFSTPYSTFGM